MNDAPPENGPPEMINTLSQLVFEAYIEEGEFKTSIYETGRDLESTDKAPGTVDIVRRLAVSIRERLSAGPIPESGGKPDQDQLIRLCKALGDQMLHTGARAVLAMSAPEYLIFRIDPSLADIPFECIHDEEDYFFRRYAISRQIRSQSPFKMKSGQTGSFPAPLKIWLLSDDSIQPPDKIPDFMDQFDSARISVTRSSVSALSLNEAIAGMGDYLLIHYINHPAAQPDGREPAGWRFSDGWLTPETVRQMGEKGETPAVVVSNAGFDSNSARSLEMADAFLSSGASHYIAVPSGAPNPAVEQFFSLFYTQIASAETIGRALRNASVRAGGDDANSSEWIPFIMYGHPGERLLKPAGGEPGEKPSSQPPTPLSEPALAEKQADILPDDESEALFREMMAGVGTEKRSTFMYRSMGSVLGLLFAAFLAATSYFFFGPHKTPDHPKKTTPQEYTEQARLKPNKLMPVLTQIQRFKRKINHTARLESDSAGTLKQIHLALDISSARINPLSKSDMLAAQIIELELRKKSHVNIIAPVSLENMAKSLRSANGTDAAWNSPLEKLRLVIFLEIGGTDRNRGVFAHLADIYSGSILETAAAPLNTDAAIVSVEDRLTGPFLKTIDALFPLSGNLIQIIDENNAVVDIGGENGLRFNQRLISVNKNNIFAIETLRTETCEVKRIKGTDTLTRGLKVIPIPE